MAELPRNFNAALIFLMKICNITNEKLAEKSLVSSKQIQRMRTNQDFNYKTETVIAVCTGLQLYPIISMEMLRMAGITLTNTRRDILYLKIIHECNELLANAGYPNLESVFKSCNSFLKLL